MTREDLFESMSFIEDEFLEKSEKKTVSWQKIAIAAACFCIVAVSAVLIIPQIIGDENVPPIENIEHQPPIPNAPIQPDSPIEPNIPIEPDNPVEPNIPIEPDAPVEPGVPVLPNTPEPPTLPEQLFDAVYNDVDSVYSAAMPNIPAYFPEQLSESELKSLELTFKEDWMNFSGVAGFDGDGSLLDVRMSTPTRVHDAEIHVAISKVWAPRDYLFSSEAQTSTIENVNVNIYRWENKDKILLSADAVIDGANVCFSVETLAEKEAEVKEDFETLIYLYAYWFNSERLDEIKAENIPEYRNETVTLSESYNDPDFGAFMPKELPNGFIEENVRRYKNYQLNYLSGLWTKGYSQINWQISYLAEGDEKRFTSVEAVENYDLSLYPIPMAESVPDELREIVNHPIFELEELTLDAVYARSRDTKEAGDVSGYRTSFDVRIGDIVIRISTKGVSPEWLYDSLKALEIQ